MNKKAEAERIIMFIPVLIFVVIIMAGFLFLSVGATLIKTPKPQEVSFTKFAKDNLLLEPVEVEFPNSEKKEILLFDAIYKCLNEDISLSLLLPALAKFIDEENKCIVISIRDEHLVAHLQEGQVKTSFYESAHFYNIWDSLGYNIRIYDEPSTFKHTLRINEKNYQILAYRGGCTR
ncbi:MAG: hypothetical protein KJ600_02235 [Nanoarchaeota archaeon]|nr:hypothetical protein [Nanoarchaeota archaeon]MBU1103353.1 hypothetical protein [Nanoarchaeota archaeon]